MTSNTQQHQPRTYYSALQQDAQEYEDSVTPPTPDWMKADDELANIPIIAVTAFAMRGDEERFREGGCQDYLSKPISVATFIGAVRKFIG